MAVIASTARIPLATSNLGKVIPAGTRLIKTYGTSQNGPKRVVYPLVVEDQDDLLLLFYRDKNDPDGRNISICNTTFRSALEMHLSLLAEDVETGNIETLPIQPSP